MTLILTCLTYDHILQVADRRLTLADGTLMVDDTNKAVFYCGRVAVSYTGPAQMEGKPTAEWIGWCMKDASEIEPAMNQIAKQAEELFRKTNLYKFAVVAAGWATLRGAQPPLPYVAVASNFMTDSWNWEDSPSEHMVVRANFLPRNIPYFVFAAGQNLTAQEDAQLKRSVGRAVQSGTPATSLAGLLGDALRFIANGSDKRAKRIGKGMIIHLLSRKAAEEGRRDILAGLTPDAHSFLYISSNDRTDPFQGAVIACQGQLLTGFTGGSLPQGGRR